MMRLATFLPSHLLASVLGVFPAEDVACARTWDDLASLVRLSPTCAILDPAADGSIRIGRIAALVRENPDLPTVIFTQVRPENLKAVLSLSKIGITDVLVHPLRHPKLDLQNSIERSCGRFLVREFLETIEDELAIFPDPMVRAVEDLFERPYRYNSATDVARQSCVHSKRLYRCFDTANIGTPKKLVTAAKVLTTYAYVRHSGGPLNHIARRLGYSGVTALERHTKEVLGCGLVDLGKKSNGGEVVGDVLHWLRNSFSATPSMRGANTARIPAITA